MIITKQGVRTNSTLLIIYQKKGNFCKNQYLKILSVIKCRMMFGLQFLCNYFLLLLTKPFSEIKIITALYSAVIQEVYKINGNGMTLENIHRAAKTEFLEKGYKDASLRNIVKSVGMTTGAFYGYYKSKEELFEAIVGEHQYCRYAAGTGTLQ